MLFLSARYQLVAARHGLIATRGLPRLFDHEGLLILGEGPIKGITYKMKSCYYHLQPLNSIPIYYSLYISVFIIQPPELKSTGVPERVSISCLTCGTRHDVAKVTGNQSYVTVGEQTLQQM